LEVIILPSETIALIPTHHFLVMSVIPVYSWCVAESWIRPSLAFLSHGVVQVTTTRSRGKRACYEWPRLIRHLPVEKKALDCFPGKRVLLVEEAGQAGCHPNNCF